MDVIECLKEATRQGASDIFIVVGRPLSIKVNGTLREITDTKILPADAKEFIEKIYELEGHRDMKRLAESGDDDFSFAIRGVSRFRVSVYRQRGSLAAVVRVITFDLPRPSDFEGTLQYLKLILERFKAISEMLIAFFIRRNVD